jgi:hypothetical protein
MQGLASDGRRAGSTERRPLVRTAAAEAHRLGLRLLVHATGLWEAKDALRAGADVLAHSVFEQPVDSEFIELARSHKAIYITTLMAGEGYIVAGQGKVDGHLYPLACSDSASRALAASGPVQGQRGRAWWTDAAAIRRIDQEVATGQANATRVHDAKSPSRSAPTPAIPARCTAPPSTASWSC